MSICAPEKDTRYDVILRDYVCGGGYTEELPLLLAEQGALGQTTGMIPAFGGQLSSGDRENLTLEQFTTRTQSDFSGGMGQYEAKGPTNRYHQGVIDSRFPGHLISPPKRTVVNAPGDGKFLVYGQYFYLVGSTALFVWNVLIHGWTLVVDFASPIQSAQVFNKRLWVAVGSTVKRATTDWGVGFEDVIGVTAKHLLVYNGYIYLLGAGGQLIYTNGTEWSEQLQVGDGTASMNALVGFRNEIVVVGSRGMWSMTADIVYQIHDWRDMEYGQAGIGAKVWAGDGRMYIPIRGGLWRWDGSALQQVSQGLEQELPANQRGTISGIAGTHEHLYVAVNALSGQSGVYAMDGQGEWHCVQLASAISRPITTLGFTAASGLLTLWWMEGTQGKTVYCNIAERWTDIGAGYDLDWESDGFVILSAIGSDVRWIDKDIDGVWLHVDNLEADKRWVEVWAEYEKNGIWVQLGVMDESPYGFIRLCQPVMAKKTVASVADGVIHTTQNTCYDMTPGGFVRIGNEVAQVKSVEFESAFRVARYMTCPAQAGMEVVASRPVAREVRLKLVLKVANSPGSCPIVRSVALKYQDRLMEFRRFTLNVLVKDGLENRQGGRYLYDAKTLREKLYAWTQRATPFVLVDVTGRAYVVKVTSVNESQYSGDSSVITMGLMQVEQSCG